MFEFDPEKSKRNKAKHGIDFNEAIQLWQDPERVLLPARSLDEIRFLLIGKINSEYWSAIYTWREEKIRIISVRKARKNEKELYHSL
jgi:uncharacterized DUF497 family protein